MADTAMNSQTADIQPTILSDGDAVAAPADITAPSHSLLRQAEPQEPASQFVTDNLTDGGSASPPQAASPTQPCEEARTKAEPALSPAPSTSLEVKEAPRRRGRPKKDRATSLVISPYAYKYDLDPSQPPPEGRALRALHTAYRRIVDVRASLTKAIDAAREIEAEIEAEQERHKNDARLRAAVLLEARLGGNLAPLVAILEQHTADDVMQLLADRLRQGYGQPPT